jgi:hypothetical protein
MSNDRSIAAAAATPAVVRASARRGLLPGLTAGLAVAAAGMVGCSVHNPGGPGYHAEFSNNPTPWVDTLDETEVEYKNQVAHTYDTNSRNILEDLGRLWLADRPSRLTPMPVPQ